MSKYDKLWQYVAERCTDKLTLSFDEINAVGTPIDHSFLKYKKESTKYGCEVVKISMKNQTVSFAKVQKRSDTAVVYIHGKGGNAAESEFYRPLFESCDVYGLDYHADTPRAAREEFPKKLDELTDGYEHVILIANSIGAYFAMHALSDRKIDRAYFVSPIVDMENLIEQMMSWANVMPTELEAAGTIQTDFGEELSWEYLRYVREHPIVWNVPTKILYGGGDNLTSRDVITAFAQKNGFELTVMGNGEHWFHTDEQMKFLSDWIKR